MTNYKEILRLKSLGLTHVDIASACGCGRNTVTRTLGRAREQGITWDSAQAMTPEELRKKLFPEEATKPQYRMPDHEKVHRELQRPGVTLSLLWVEYCEECRAAGELPYQSTQFNKYYADYVHKTKATMRLEHRPGETMQVDWAGQVGNRGTVEAGTNDEVVIHISFPLRSQLKIGCISSDRIFHSFFESAEL